MKRQRTAPKTPKKRGVPKDTWHPKAVRYQDYVDFVKGRKTWEEL